MAYRYFAMKKQNIFKRHIFASNSFYKIVTDTMDLPDFKSKVNLWKILWEENWFIHLYKTVVSPVKLKKVTIKIKINLIGGMKCYNYLKD
jgi:hypothetical protein